MTIDLYSVVYIVSNVLFTYTIFKFFQVFFGLLITSKRKEFISYAGYFIVSTGIYFIINVPIVWIVSNIVLFFLLTLIYKSTIKRRIISVALMYLVFLCIETIIALSMGYFEFPLYSLNKFSSIFGIILIRCSSFIVALIAAGFKNIKSNVQIPTIYWVSIILVPLSSIVMVIMLLNQNRIDTNALLACVVLLLLMNVMTFYLYDKIVVSAENKTKMLLSAQQNKYYEKHFELMKSSMTSIKILRHDLKNQLCAIQVMAKSGDVQSLINHMDSLIGTNDLSKSYANSGNVNIDSILNFKISEAEQAGIPTSLLLRIPDSIELSSVDLCSILGNLIDNAMHAVCKTNIVERKIDIAIRYDKKRLLITVSNTFSNEILYDGDKLMSSHENKSEHGLGLLSVKNTVDRCEGIMDIEHTANIFTVTIIIPV